MWSAPISSASATSRCQPTAGSFRKSEHLDPIFPFVTSGQLEGVQAVGPANPSVVSGAYGGFSNIWGAQIMPFSKATFDRWPITSAEMESHYRIALSEMTLAGDEDDLSELFPLMVPARPLPPLADRSQRVLDRYQAQRAFVRSHGITVGRARLAFRADECTRCGLCMTGCPHDLIYSSAHTFDRLRSEGRITYRPNMLAVHLRGDRRRSVGCGPEHQHRPDGTPHG